MMFLSHDNDVRLFNMNQLMELRSRLEQAKKTCR